jgi:hypothetical protein
MDESFCRLGSLSAAACILLPTRSERASAQSESLNINAVDPDIVAPEFDKFIEAVKENGATNLGAGLPFYTSFQRSTCRTWAAISPLVASQTSSQPPALAAIASNAQAPAGRP